MCCSSFSGNSVPGTRCATIPTQPWKWGPAQKSGRKVTRPGADSLSGSSPTVERPPLKATYQISNSRFSSKVLRRLPGRAVCRSLWTLHSLATRPPRRVNPDYHLCGQATGRLWSQLAMRVLECGARGTGAVAQCEDWHRIDCGGVMPVSCTLR